MAEPVHERRWWHTVPLTGQGSNIATHPRATLDAQAARLMNARQTVNQLHMAIQANDMRFKTTLADIEKHYHEQVDGVEKQYHGEASTLAVKYREAHALLMREQRAMAEQLKHVDCKAEFITHFPSPPSDESGS